MKKKIILGVILILIIASFVFANSDEDNDEEVFEPCFDIWVDSVENNNPFNLCNAFCVDELEKFGSTKDGSEYNKDWATGKCTFIPDKAGLVMFSPEKLETMEEVILPMDENEKVRYIESEDLACAEQDTYSMVYFDYREMDWVVIDDSSVDFDEETGLIVSLNKEGINELLEKALDFYYLTIIEKRVPYFNENICTLTRCPRGQNVYTLDNYYDQYDSKIINDSKFIAGEDKNIFIDFVACPDTDLEFFCTSEDDGCCAGIGRSVLSEDFYELHGVVGSLYGRECEEDKDCVDFFICKEEQCRPPEGKEVIYSFEVCERLTGHSSPYCVVDLGVLGDPNCVAEAYYRPSMSWNLPEEELSGVLTGTKGTSFFSLDNVEEKSNENYEVVIQGSEFFISHEEKTDGASSISGEKMMMKSVYPGIYGLTNFDSCNYEIDGFCDPNCPTYEIIGEKYSDALGYYLENKQVTRYVDPDCCQLTKVIDGEEVKGLAAASSEADGCCKPVCDGVCDPDCLFGQDPDCMDDYIKHPDDWVDRLNNVQDDYAFSKDDFYYVSDSSISGETNCMGCGNGRCDWNVWGGGRIRQPWYAWIDSNVDLLNRLEAGYQVVPSFYDVIRYNWNYVKEGLDKIEEKGAPTLYTNLPFAFHSFMYHGHHTMGYCKHEWEGLEDRKVWGSCYAFYNSWIREKIDNRAIFPNLRGRQGYFKRGNPGNVDISYKPILDNLFNEDGFKGTSFDIEQIDFRPWYTLYPFDENPSNCPDDCNYEEMCGDEICQPWEQSGEYRCESDCNKIDLDFDSHEPGEKVVHTLPLNYWIWTYLDEEEQGVCLTRDRYPKILTENKNRYTEFNSPKEHELESYDSSALCAFSYPGQQGNCPAGSVCDYNCGCVPMSDVPNIVAYIDNLEEEIYPGSYWEGAEFYRSLLKNIDRDLDGWPACTEDDNMFSGECDCNDYDTSINPDAIDFCDGVDRNCDGITDNSHGSEIPSSACDMDMWICREDEFVIEDGKILGCFNPYCTRPKGEGGGEIFRCTFDNINLEPSLEPYEYYVYFCDPDNIGERCEDYAFKGEFQVCWDSEDAEPGFCFDGIDNDCDGVIDSEDPDCFSCDPDGDYRCNLKTKEWCKEGVGEGDSPGWVSDPDSYCGPDACGMLDSSCIDEAEVCEEGETSCGKGCFPGACDIYAQKVCNNFGAWVGGSEYFDSCAKLDQSSETIDCEPGACDYVNQWTCSQGGEWIGTVLHCSSNRACGQKYDADCEGECEPGACDTEHNKYCTSDNEWSSNDYCLNCGYTDADCGVQACKEGACDYVAFKVCENGVWVEKDEDNFCQDCPETPNCIVIAEGMELYEAACWPGTTDNCGTDVGICEFGTKTCQEDYSWGDCVGGVGPQAEVCDGLDNNCDGSVDEGCQCEVGEVRRCGANQGQCSSGLQECTEEGLWSVCHGASYNPPSESVCDGSDNNCDGNIDVGCICTPGETQPCGESEGECQQGVQTCLNNNVWGECTGMKGPLPEQCDDGLDNDCDGLIDNDDPDCHPDLPPLKSYDDEPSYESPPVQPPIEKDEKEEKDDEQTIFKPEKKDFPIFTLILAFLFLGIVGAGGFVVFKNIKSGRKPLDITWLNNKLKGKSKEQVSKETSSKQNISKSSYKPKQSQTKVTRKEKFKTKEEKALEESFKKSQDMFK